MEDPNKLTGEEILVIQMALTDLIEYLGEMNQQVDIPFTPEARKANREMIAASKSAQLKLEKITGINVNMEPYKEGDEKQFLTKES